MKKLVQLCIAILEIIALVLSTFPIAFAQMDRDNFPRMDDMYEIQCVDEDGVMAAARAGEIDTAFDLRNPDYIQELAEMGWSISINMGFGFGYVGENCRDVCPDTAGTIQDIGRSPGDPLFPMNISGFRFALHLIIGGEVKDTIVSEVFGWTAITIDTIPSPAAGFWHNPDLIMPHDETEAYRILTEDLGFSNASGYWVNTNPDIGPIGEIRPPSNPIQPLGCPEAATSISLITQKFIAEWNRFFGKMSDGTSDYFQYIEFPWPIFGEMVYTQRDIDMAGWSHRVGRDPDYLFDFFHSSNIGPGDSNWVGYSDPVTDELLYAIKYWRWTDGTYITTLDEMVEIVWAAQERIFYAQPYLVDCAGFVINAFAPGLKCWIESLGYGSNNDWTKRWLMWNTTKSEINMCNSGTISTLNPGYSSSVYDWEVLGLVYDGLMTIEPFDHNDVNWAICDYTIEPCTSPNVPYGQRVTFYLREGIYWHDGDPFTADDALYSWDFICNITMGRWSDIWTTFISSNKVNDYEFEVYMNCTGIWYVYSYAETAMLFPEVIWQNFWNDPIGAETFEPSLNNYDTFTGSIGHGGLTCLVGTGTYILVDWDQVAAVVYLTANRPDTVWTGNPGYWAPFLREDLNFDGIVDLFDAVILAGSAGATPGSARWRRGRADLNCDGLVDVFDAVLLAGRIGLITLPPCLYSPVGF